MPLTLSPSPGPHSSGVPLMSLPRVSPSRRSVRGFPLPNLPGNPGLMEASTTHNLLLPDPPSRHPPRPAVRAGRRNRCAGEGGSGANEGRKKSSCQERLPVSRTPDVSGWRHFRVCGPRSGFTPSISNGRNCSPMTCVSCHVIKRGCNIIHSQE